MVSLFVSALLLTLAVPATAPGAAVPGPSPAAADGTTAPPAVTGGLGVRIADPLAALERQQQELFDRIAPSVVYLSRGDAFGSGFFVAPGQILTNAHVVGKKDRVLVVLHDGKKVEGRVVELGKNDLDLALVEVPVTGIRPLPLSSASLRVGAWVASVSHGYGGIWTFTTGMVSNIYPTEGDRPVFQTQIPLNPGSSGGPVFDRDGRVVGVVTAGIEQAQGINFAIRSDEAFEALPHLAAVDPERLAVSAPAGATVLVDGKLAGKGPRVLVRVGPGTHRVQAIAGGAMKEKRVVWPDDRTVNLE
jgi:serine protease Do